MKFYASVRLEIKKTGVVKGKGGDYDITGNLVRVKVAKNKLAPPFRTADFEMSYGAGVSRSGEVVDLGVASGVLGRSGAWYVFATPEAAAAVTKAFATTATVAPSPTLPSPTRSSDILANLARAKGKSSKKTTKGVKGRGKDDADAEAEAAEAEAEGRSVTAPAAATFLGPSPSDGSLAPPETVTAGAPFAQGRDKAKAWFEARPAAMEAVGSLIRAALKAAPPVLGASVAAGAAAAAPASGSGTFAAVGVIDARLPGPLLDEEDELFGEEGK